jgi:NAD-dependent deacetylase
MRFARVESFDRFAPVTLDARDRVFVLTGAGISAESGIRTFRDAGGLWESYRIEDVASPEAWAEDPERVWRFYSQRRVQAQECAPNAAHLALAKAQAALGDRFFLCTQNVDPLHERAGSTRVIHMHGELLRSRCESCDDAAFEDLSSYMSAAKIPRCACGARIRPHIVWFGEIPLYLPLIEDALQQTTVFVTIGSSGAVYPAASFALVARAQGARTIYVGPEEPDNLLAFDECRLGKAAAAVPGLFAF